MQSYETYEEGPISTIPPEVLQLILDFAAKDSRPTTLQLVCRQWNFLTQNLFERIVRDVWPSLFDRIRDEPVNWPALYVRKNSIEENVKACRYELRELSIPVSEQYEPGIYPAGRHCIAMIRKTNDLIPMGSHIFQKQLEIIDIKTGNILHVIEIKNAFCIKDDSLYMDDAGQIKAYNIHTGKYLFSFKGYLGIIESLLVDDHQTLITLTMEYKFHIVEKEGKSFFPL